MLIRHFSILIDAFQFTTHTHRSFVLFHGLVVSIESSDWKVSGLAVGINYDDTFASSAAWCSHPDLLLRERYKFFVSVWSLFD